MADKAGPMALAVFVAPKIRVLDHVTRSYRDGIGQSAHLVIEVCGFYRRFGCLDQPDGLFVKIPGKNYPSIPGLQPSVLMSRNQNRRRLAVTENLDWLALGIAKRFSELPLSIRRLDLRHLHLPIERNMRILHKLHAYTPFKSNEARASGKSKSKAGH